MQKNCPVLPLPDSIQKIIVAVIWIMINRKIYVDYCHQAQEVSIG